MLGVPSLPSLLANSAVLFGLSGPAGPLPPGAPRSAKSGLLPRPGVGAVELADESDVWD